MPIRYSLPTPQKQQGIALFAALMLIVLLTMIGFRVAEQGKSNTAITGSTVRYNQVFEAGEQTLRRAMLFIRSIRNGEPIATNKPSDNYNAQTGDYATKDTFANFDINQIVNSQTQEPTAAAQLMTSDTNYSFVWKSGELGKVICGQTAGRSNCPVGIDFQQYIDSNVWRQQAIKSSFEGSGNTAIDTDSYLSSIRTYTFIEVLSGNGQSKGGFGRNSPTSTTSGGVHYYLITVKASGYPPIYTTKGGKTSVTVDDSDPLNARENVILQAVYAQMY